MRKNVWFKSSKSANNGQCVEVIQSDIDGHVLVRHSKSPTGPMIHFSKDEWAAFVLGVKNNEFDV